MNFEQPPEPSIDEPKISEAESNGEGVKDDADLKVEQQIIDGRKDEIEGEVGGEIKKELSVDKQNLESGEEIKKKEVREFKESLTIDFPKDIEMVRALQSKLAEYKERFNQADKGSGPVDIDTKYKIAVLEELLTSGKVNMYGLAGDIKKAEGFVDNNSFFNNYSEILRYIKAGGEGVKDDADLKVEQQNIDESVKVQRSSGEIEDGWNIANKDGEYVFVVKKDENGRILRKAVLLEEFEKLNPKIDEKKDQKSKEGPTIDFPKDIEMVRALQSKLAEYKERFSQVGKTPESFADMGVNYRIFVLEELLKSGRVSLYELSKKIGKIEDFNSKDFIDAYSLIGKYVKDGGEGIRGGTGLKFNQQNSKEGKESTMGL